MIDLLVSQNIYPGHCHVETIVAALRQAIMQLKKAMLSIKNTGAPAGVAGTILIK